MTATEFGSVAHLTRVFERACRERVPLCGAFDLTYRCNFRCTHCYAGPLSPRSGRRGDELGTQEVVDLLSEAAQAGCLAILFSGGEPLLRSDFAEIYVAARRLGLLVSVFTNASLVTAEHLEVFSDYPPHVVEISLYGMTEATCARVTGVAGALARVKRGIERLLEHRVRVSLKTMILRDNWQEIPAMAAFADSLGVGFRCDPLVTPRLNGDLSPLLQRIDPDKAVQLELATEEQRESARRFFERHSRAEPGTRVSEDQVAPEREYLCGAGVASFHLDPAGIMRPCLMSVQLAHDAVRLGFLAAWEKTRLGVDRAKVEAGEQCAQCPLIYICGYCPGLFALERSSAGGPPEYVCKLGESRRRALALPALGPGK